MCHENTESSAFVYSYSNKQRQQYGPRVAHRQSHFKPKLKSCKYTYNTTTPCTAGRSIAARRALGQRQKIPTSNHKPHNQTRVKDSNPCNTITSTMIYVYTSYSE